MVILGMVSSVGFMGLGDQLLIVFLDQYWPPVNLDRMIIVQILFVMIAGGYFL